MAEQCVLVRSESVGHGHADTALGAGTDINRPTPYEAGVRVGDNEHYNGHLGSIKGILEYIRHQLKLDTSLVAHCILTINHIHWPFLTHTMPISNRILAALALWSFLSPSWAADQPAYQPCPIFRAYYPPPTIDKSSDVMQSFSKNLTVTFDELVRTGKHEIYGDITPNSTSFSVVLFSTADDPIFFSYHRTAPAADVKSNVTMDTVFPVGSLTQLFTVYAWLAKFGDKEWDSPITKFLPELLGPSTTPGKITVPWSEVTIGALASHMAGIVRDCMYGLE